MKKAIFLFDYTGIMAKPWAEAGYLCYCFDGQHPLGVSKSEHPNILNVGMWFDNDGIYGKNDSDIEKIKLITGSDISFVFGFPECTDLTVAGARHFDSKRKADPRFQFKAMQLVYLTKNLGESLNCPWGFENPVGVISTMFRTYDFKFDPADYAGYLPEMTHIQYIQIFTRGKTGTTKGRVFGVGMDLLSLKQDGLNRYTRIIQAGKSAAVNHSRQRTSEALHLEVLLKQYLKLTINKNGR